MPVLSISCSIVVLTILLAAWLMARKRSRPGSNPPEQASSPEQQPVQTDNVISFEVAARMHSAADRRRPARSGQAGLAEQQRRLINQFKA